MRFRYFTNHESRRLNFFPFARPIRFFLKNRISIVDKLRLPSDKDQQFGANGLCNKWTFGIAWIGRRANDQKCTWQQIVMVSNLASVPLLRTTLACRRELFSKFSVDFLAFSFDCRWFHLFHHDFSSNFLFIHSNFSIKMAKKFHNFTSSEKKQNGRRVCSLRTKKALLWSINKHFHHFSMEFFTKKSHFTDAFV